MGENNGPPGEAPRRANASISDIFKASSQEMKSTGSMPRRRIVFDVDMETVAVDPALQAAGMMEITLQTLSAREESQATTSAKSGMEMGMALAMRSVVEVGGEVIKSPGMREWFWNAVGPKGRNLIAGMYAEITAPDEETEKKAEASVRYE